MKHLRVD
jgi:hypothetical protein